MNHETRIETECFVSDCDKSNELLASFNFSTCHLPTRLYLMRSFSLLLSIALVYITLVVTLALAEPVPIQRKLPQKLIRERSNGERVGIAFGRPGDGYINQGKGNEAKVNGASKKGDAALNEDGTSNYVSLLLLPIPSCVSEVMDESWSLAREPVEAAVVD